jgi:methyl-accepting chemotaxis protein
LSDPTAATGAPSSPAPKTRHKRKFSNYLLDKKLQLRYVLVVTILSGVIAGALGFLIYQQRRAASESIEKDLAALTQKDTTQDQFQEQIASDLQSEDKALVYKMVGVGAALVIILSLYLVIMTHKVAGPLFKVSMYFERMADGRLGVVTPLRKGDMLVDFYVSFKEMHDAVRARAQDDVATMDKAIAALRDGKNQADYRGEAHGKLVEALEALEKHVSDRKAKLTDFPPRTA